MVQGGVLSVRHACAGASLGDDLLGRQEQLVQERDDVATHKIRHTLAVPDGARLGVTLPSDTS